MKIFKTLFLLAGVAALIGRAQAQDFAPANLSSAFFNGTITSATGVANGTGTFSTLFASNGVDYSENNGALTDPVPFTYTKTGANSATITEGASGSLPGVSVALTFTSASAGTFVATYSNNTSQRGSFTLTPIAFTSPLINVSTRTTLAANGTSITGFVIGGSGPRRVLIRAVGPGLAPFGVAGALTNPALTVFRGNTAVGGNDDYASGTNIDATLPSTFARVGAFGLPASSRDAALITTLEPGPYTAVVRGGTATEAGEVLLEVYFLD